MLRLNVNIDHVATVRQARRAAYPDPVEAARIAEAAGAHGMTVHLRGDRRHIQDHDLDAAARMVRGKLNLEMAATDEMSRSPLASRPDQVTLVPERDAEITTEGGLGVASVPGSPLRAPARRRPFGRAVHRSRRVADRRGARAARARLDRGRRVQHRRLRRRRQRQRRTSANSSASGWRRGARPAPGSRVYAGHALRLDNVGPVAAIAEIEELNIGHALVGRALLVGMAEAVREFLAAMRRVAAPTRQRLEVASKPAQKLLARLDRGDRSHRTPQGDHEVGGDLDLRHAAAHRNSDLSSTNPRRCATAAPALAQLPEDQV